MMDDKIYPDNIGKEVIVTETGTYEVSVIGTEILNPVPSIETLGKSELDHTEEYIDVEANNEFYSGEEYYYDDDYDFDNDPHFNKKTYKHNYDEANIQVFTDYLDEPTRSADDDYDIYEEIKKLEHRHHKEEEDYAYASDFDNLCAYIFMIEEDF